MQKDGELIIICIIITITIHITKKLSYFLSFIYTTFFSFWVCCPTITSGLERLSFSWIICMSICSNSSPQLVIILWFHTTPPFQKRPALGGAFQKKAVLKDYVFLCLPWNVILYFPCTVHNVCLCPATLHIG